MPFPDCRAAGYVTISMRSASQDDIFLAKQPKQIKTMSSGNWSTFPHARAWFQSIFFVFLQLPITNQRVIKLYVFNVGLSDQNFRQMRHMFGL